MTTQAAGPGEDADLEAIRIHKGVKAAGGAALATGVFTALLGVQTIAVVAHWTLYIGLTAFLQCGLGLASAYFGVRLMRMRGWAALAASGSLGVLVLVNLAWFVYAISQGVLSLLALGLCPLSGLSAVGAGLCIPITRKADRARDRLRDQGIEAGD